MEGIEMKSTQIDLSEYAYVVINLNLYDGQSGVTISKKPWGKDMYTSATLNVDEWSELARTLQELKKSAQEMHEKTQLNEMSGSRAPTLPWNVSKILSTKYMTKLNLWNAPNGMTYITLAIRPYVLNKDSEPCMQKGVGVTLSYRELHNLSDSAFSISNTISEQMSSTRFVSLVDMSDVEREQKKMELFFQMATPGQKCRVIMEKKERTWLTSSNVAAAAAAALPSLTAPAALLASPNDVTMALPNPPSVHGTNASSVTTLESIESVSRALLQWAAPRSRHQQRRRLRSDICRFLLRLLLQSTAPWLRHRLRSQWQRRHSTFCRFRPQSHHYLSTYNRMHLEKLRHLLAP